MMVLQAESIQKFLAPCKHWVIVNEFNVNIDAWRELLAPYYINHELEIVALNQLFVADIPIIGEQRQQICKLEIARLIKDDYLILDTKNFFIKPASLNEWDRYIGSGEVEFVDIPPSNYHEFQPQQRGCDPTWSETLKEYARTLTIQLPPFYICPKTPFKIDYKFIKDILFTDMLWKIILLTADEKERIETPSEFIFYSLVNRSNIYPGKNTIIDIDAQKTWTAFYHNFEKFSEELLSGEQFNYVEYSNVKVYGFHRRLLEQCGPEHMKEINKYLKKKGFDFRFI